MILVVSDQSRLHSSLEESWPPLTTCVLPHSAGVAEIQTELMLTDNRLLLNQQSQGDGH